jgi:hypothetical protein
MWRQQKQLIFHEVLISQLSHLMTSAETADLPWGVHHLSAVPHKITYWKQKQLIYNKGVHHLSAVQLAHTLWRQRKQLIYHKVLIISQLSSWPTLCDVSRNSWFTTRCSSSLSCPAGPHSVTSAETADLPQGALLSAVPNRDVSGNSWSTTWRLTFQMSIRLFGSHLF